jgi:hypothetical protein
MASPRRIYRIYFQLGTDAELVHDFQVANGEKPSGTVDLLRKRDAAKTLARWAEEMDELCGVLDGSHKDPYVMEATQTFYWASLYGFCSGVPWEDLDFDGNRRAAITAGIDSPDELRAAVKRIAELGAAGPTAAKPAKLFLLWNVADHLYRKQTPPDRQRSLDDIMEIDLQEMRKRPYLYPILKMIGEDKAAGGK